MEGGSRVIAERGTETKSDGGDDGDDDDMNATGVEALRIIKKRTCRTRRISVSKN